MFINDYLKITKATSTVCKNVVKYIICVYSIIQKSIVYFFFHKKFLKIFSKLMPLEHPLTFHKVQTLKPNI